jgi:hypothetical protein
MRVIHGKVERGRWPKSICFALLPALSRSHAVGLLLILLLENKQACFASRAV